MWPKHSPRLAEGPAPPARPARGPYIVKGSKMKDTKRNFLTESEVEAFLKAARRMRNPERDHCMMLLAYRHGLRVSELINIRLSDLDLDAGRFYVRRLKNSLSTHQTMMGDEMRACRAWMRARLANRGAASDYLFLSEQGTPFNRGSINYLVSEIGRRARLPLKAHPHMLRHSCGYALANKGRSTRDIQDFLGHKQIRHTVIYTQTNSARFRDIWK